MLKLQLDWTVSKVVWYDQVVQLRALFEKNLAAGSTTAEAFLQQVEHDLKTYKHPDPYKFPFYEYKDENGIVVGTGTKFQRNTPRLSLFWMATCMIIMARSIKLGSCK